MFKKTILDNKLRIITAPMTGTNTVTVLVLCATGSDYESKTKNGISHFLEHMFFKGTTERSGPLAIPQELDGLGAMYNAFTSHEYTGYYVKVGKTYFERALDVLADIYCNSLLDAGEIEKEKQVIVEELRKDRDTPTQYVWWIWERLLYGDQPAGWDVIGDETTIRGLTRPDLVEYFTHQYVASNTIVVVAGSMDEAHAVSYVTERFRGVRHGPPIRPRAATAEAQRVPDLQIEQRATDQTHLTIGFRGIDAHDSRRYAAMLLATLLGGGMSSRMFTKIREELGLAYTVATAHEVYADRGHLVTYAGAEHGNAAKVVEAALGEYRRVRDELVPDNELKRVKDYIRGITLIGLEQSSAVANFVGAEEILTGEALTVEEVFAKMDMVTSADIQDVAREFVRPERLNLGMVSPLKDDTEFRKLLNAL
ncbi:MAG: processing protease [Parcubacteria group bacterium Gr01-1014_106]|nr:MAG: processing protease [Parcubacteria group bacterium Gr01-1014_106]